MKGTEAWKTILIAVAVEVCVREMNESVHTRRKSLATICQWVATVQMTTTSVGCTFAQETTNEATWRIRADFNQTTFLTQRKHKVLHIFVVVFIVVAAAVVFRSRRFKQL